MGNFFLSHIITNLLIFLVFLFFFYQFEASGRGEGTEADSFRGV